MSSDENTKIKFGLPDIQVEKFWQLAKLSPIDAEQVKMLRQSFYPNFSDEQIIAIERSALAFFQAHSETPKWVRSQNILDLANNYGLKPTDETAHKLHFLEVMADAPESNAAFSPLSRTNKLLALPDHKSLEDEALELMRTGKNSPMLINIGSGGQLTELQLDILLREQGVDPYIIGMTAFDYSENVRLLFPEIPISNFRQDIFHLKPWVLGNADLVFSVRTAPYTGLVDNVRFLAAAHQLAKPDGKVWIDDIFESCFDFSDSDFNSLEDYLEYLQLIHPSLRYKNTKGSFTLYWDKSEGYPFGMLKATNIFSDGDIPRWIIYSPPKIINTNSNS